MSRSTDEPAARSDRRAFAFRQDLLQWSLPMAAPSDRPTELPRVLSLRDATMLVVSSVIGVGIFLTPGGVAKLLPQPGWFCAAWLAGGVLALAGALANAELGAMFPRAGG